jgi:hypothetical protein
MSAPFCGGTVTLPETPTVTLLLAKSDEPKGNDENAPVNVAIFPPFDLQTTKDDGDHARTGPALNYELNHGAFAKQPRMQAPAALFGKKTK